jgi:hypothetical protein
MRSSRLTILLVSLAAAAYLAISSACGGGGGQTPGATPVATAEVQEDGGGGEEVSLDDFASSARPVCSEFANRLSLTNPGDSAPYEDAASGLAELALPSGAAERKRAEALVEAMGEAAVATREFSKAIEPYLEPGMGWVLSPDGRVFPLEGSTIGDEFADFPTEIGRHFGEALDTLRQAAADAGLHDCAPPRF